MDIKYENLEDWGKSWTHKTVETELLKSDKSEIWKGGENSIVGSFGEYYYWSGGWGVILDPEFTLDGKRVEADKVVQMGYIPGTGSSLMYVNVNL